ncbi:MAG: TIGR02099 family protein [Polaromonas sp.]|nr:TIGR02099 family protein [Polaromonas sp.]
MVPVISTLSNPSTCPEAPGLAGRPSATVRRWRWLARTSGLLMWLLVTAWLLFGMTWLFIHGWIVPRIGELRPRLEVVASQALGVPVRIGQITAESTGLIPSFELRDVTLLDAQARVAVRLPRLLGTLSPTSLWGLGFEQLVIDRPELDIRRAADGKIYAGGLDVSTGLNTSDSHSRAADWLFSQPELLLRGGLVRWTDELRAVPPLTLTGVDFVLRNNQRRHQMRLDATPPTGWGERFTARGLFHQPLLLGASGDFSTWSGQLYADFANVDVSQLRQYAMRDKEGELALDIQRGHGALRAWADIRKGQMSSGTADVALRDVDVRLGAKLEPLAFVVVAGRVGARQRVDGFDFSTEGFSFSTPDGLQWPGGNLTLAHTDAQGSNAASTDVKADRLDLAALAQIASRLPLSSATRELIASFAPQGLVEALQARWQGPLDRSPVSYTAKGRLVGLTLASLPAPATIRSVAPFAHEAIGRPGVSGASLDFDMTEAGGHAQVVVTTGALDLPGVFEEPRVPLDKLSTDAQWSRVGGRWQVQLRDLQFSNADGQGKAQVSWRSADSAVVSSAVPHSSLIDLHGSLSRADGARIHRYLPLVLPEQARHYVRDAVVQGQLSDVKFKVNGPVQKIPFADASLGDFRISAKVKNGQLAYVPAFLQPPGAPLWPALTGLSGELLFNRTSIDVKGVTGGVLGLPGLQLVKGDARIPDLTRGTTVEVAVALKGPLNEALRYVNTSPVSALTGQALLKATGTGVAEYRLKLNLPVHSISSSQVDGSVTLPGNDVYFVAGSPALSQLKGTVTFSERGFTVADARARMLGGDVRIEGGMRAGPRLSAGTPDGEGSVSFKAQGTATAEGLRQAKELGLSGVLANLAANASGSTAYTASLGFRRGTVELSVASSLQGLALNLPSPMGKAADSSLPLRFDKSLVPESMVAGQKLQDQLSLSLGAASNGAVRPGGATPVVNLLAMTYVRDISASEPRVLRGSLAVGPGENIGLPATGVAANINLPQVDLDAWERALEAPPAGAAAAGAAASSSAISPLAQSYLPTTLAIRARELVAYGHRLNHVVVGGTREGAVWRANLNADELNGYVEFRQPSGAGGPSGRLYARLSRLNLAAGAASNVEAALNEQPASIPALDIVVEDVELRGLKLGRVEVEAVNRIAQAAGNGVREWRLNKFNVILPEARLTATGNWAAPSAQVDASVAIAANRPLADRRRSAMKFTLDIADSGELLRRFGMGDVIRRGKGKLEGQVAWIGSPLSLDTPSLAGQFNVNLEAGQFIKADPGLAKLLGVLSLQSLPRRLTLDFRDVFSEGFAFDFVRGDVNIDRGLATTNNLQMSGVNAAVLMEGSADIARETQDLKVVVVPEINAGTASLIATVINPIVGLGTFLAQAFLRRPLMQAATQEFHISGTWADPKVSKIDRRSQAQRPAGTPN